MSGLSIGGAVGGAGTGFQLGAATGIPHVAGIGAAVGGIAGLFSGGGGNKSGNGEKTRRRKTHKQNKKIWKYNKKENKRKYEHELEALKIRKANDKETREYQEQINENNYDHAMAIRDYEFSQSNRAYDRSVADANAQISFNQMASSFAIRQQDRYKEEMLRGMMLDKRQSNLNFELQSAGLANTKDALDVKKRAVTAAAGFKTQSERIKSLKSEGEAAARGPGRSNAKAVQAALAESGANQAAIAEELMFGLSDIDVNYDNLAIKADGMSKQLILDNVKLKASMMNLEHRDQMAREEIAFKLADANRRAEASIRLKPELSPAMPRPVALPKPEYQDIYKPKDPPKPKRGAMNISSPTQSWAQSVAPGVMGAIQSFANSGIFNGGSGYAANVNTLGSSFNPNQFGAASSYLSGFGNSSGLLSGFTSPFSGTGGGGFGVTPMTSGLDFSSRFMV